MQRNAPRNLSPISPLHSSRSPRQVEPIVLADFDSIDGVLLRGSQAIPRAADSLRLLQSKRIPFILLTNGGGKSETARAAALSQELDVELEPSLVVQSHTPFAGYEHLKDKCVLVLGGEGNACKQVAEEYGFKHVVTSSDIYNQHPHIWPFSSVFSSYYAQPANQPTHPITLSGSDPAQNTKIDAIFVFNDPRDWALDITLTLDLLLSANGRLGTLSPHNNDAALPNRGYQQHGQPPLLFSNPDLWWAAQHPLPRLGQGGFRAALEGVWAAVTGGAALRASVIGKPSAATFAFAETALVARRAALLRGADAAPLRTVFMVGDNPASDIAGAVAFTSARGVRWRAALTRTGVFRGGEPAHAPEVVVADVWEAVAWGLEQGGGGK